MPVLRVVVSALHVLDRGRDRNRAAQMRAGPRHALEVRQSIQRHVYFARRSAELVAINLFEEVSGKMLGVDKLGERKPRIDARRDYVRIYLVAVGQHHTLGLATL